MSWKFGSAANVGGRNEQQDRVAVLHAADGHRHLVVVADGMGGLRYGALAAQTLVDVASRRFAEPHGNSGFDFLQDICLEAHALLRKLTDDALPAPGTTAVLLYLNKHTASWMHVGDSRLYHFRDGCLSSCTNDHSMLRLMLGGGLVAPGSDEAAVAQSRLYMRLGSETVPEPDFNSCKLEDGDLFLLCSDGLWQALESEEMLAVLKQHPLDQDGPQYLTELALQRSGDGCDNISIAVAQWQGNASRGWQWVRKVFGA